MSEFQRALRRLIQREPGWRRFAGQAGKPETPAPIPAARGVAMSAGAVAQPGGSEFEEIDAVQREYWPTRVMTTTDGLFTWEVEPIKSILLADGSRATFAEPPADDGEGDGGD